MRCALHTGYHCSPGYRGMGNYRNIELSSLELFLPQLAHLLAVGFGLL